MQWYGYRQCRIHKSGGPVVHNGQNTLKSDPIYRRGENGWVHRFSTSSPETSRLKWHQSMCVHVYVQLFLTIASVNFSTARAILTSYNRNMGNLIVKFTKKTRLDCNMSATDSIARMTVIQLQATECSSAPSIAASITSTTYYLYDILHIHTTTTQERLESLEIFTRQTPV